MMDILLLISLFVGFILGIFSGLTPGLHSNNFAALLLAISPALLRVGLDPLDLATAILAASVSHTFLDIIPSIFIGAPDADTALAVLPGHEMMLEGRGIEAVRLSALGSASSILVALALIVPLSLLFGRFYDPFMDHVGLVLLAIAAVTILTERGEVIEGQGSLAPLKYKLIALLLFLTSGLLGTFAFGHQDLARSPLGFQPEVLMPLLGGLFGASMLLISLGSRAEVPDQRETAFEMPARTISKAAFLGGFAGSVVAWVPGVTPAVATVATRFGSDCSGREFLISVSGVNTANALLTMVALLVVGRPRSGAAVAIEELVELDGRLLLFMVTVVVFVSILSYLATLAAGRAAAEFVRRLNYRRLCIAVLALLTALTYAFTGTFGLFLYLVSTVVGLMAPFAGVRKTHAMGVLMVPLLTYYL
ncbi:MAG TPA: tripartite tricarboxylate transporter permease [Methanothrix sp.]|jgi:putative membrane protein|nr:tripartite tricarboxylate transporter permease [Methanothrix sp.]